MAFSGYREDLGDYYCNDPYNDYYFSSTPIQYSSQYTVSPPESDYYEYYHSASEPIHYAYYSVNDSPDPHSPLYYPSDPQFRISYSVVDFNEPDFDEYDPTPYGGGYDQATTYGKPIPPSDATCYPRSAPKPDAVSSEKFSYASIPSPYGKDNQDRPIEPPTRTEQIVDSVENGDLISTGDGAEQIVNGSDESEIEFGNETKGDYGCEGERLTEMGRTPYGSGLETVDICESLFGYWPCLAKKAQEEKRICGCQERRMDPWGSAADYLFGSPFVCNGYGNYHQQDQYYYK